MEIAGILSAVLAYGRVEQIEKSVSILLGHMGKSPFEFVQSFTRDKRRKLKSFKHRFTTGDNISDMLELLREVIAKSGTIENFFAEGFRNEDPNTIGALTKFCNRLRKMHIKKHGNQLSRGLKYLLAGPSGGSACKRLNLFLRWMVRDSDVDAGLWKSIDKAKLIVPVDVHMSRLCRISGLYNGKTTSLTAAVRITEAFARIAPADPVKYDFPLSRIGILDNCNGHRRDKCRFCELFAVCFRR
jgi:uncharacterized protein (TIGR02757 family)